MVNLTSKLTVGIAHDRAGNNRTSDSASTTQSNLRRNKDVGDILVLTKERNVENDLEGLSIRSHHDEGALTTIQSLRSYIHNQLSTHTFIGSLLQLTVVGSLLDQIQNRSSQFGRGKRIGLRTIVILRDHIPQWSALRSYSERCFASAIMRWTTIKAENGYFGLVAGKGIDLVWTCFQIPYDWRRKHCFQEAEDHFWRPKGNSYEYWNRLGFLWFGLEVMNNI